MRICLISKEYPPDTGWGGIGTYTYQIAHGLVAIGHEVEVVALASANQAASSKIESGILVHRAAWSELLNELIMVLISTPYSHYTLKTVMALWMKFLAVHAEKPFDVVEAPELLAESLLPSLTKVAPLVVRLHTPHSKFVSENFHNFSATFDNQFICALERVAMTSADVITSPSENMADFVCRDFGYPRESVEIVRNPVDSERFKPEGPKAFGHEGKLSVLFVGRIEARKGIHYLMDAIPRVVKEFPAVHFTIVGADTNTARGKKSVKAELEKMLLQSGMSSYVTFAPPAPYAEVPDYYRASDICVIPSLYDNAPCTCLEAMSTGRAVIGTQAGGMPEYMVANENGILIPAKDAQAISAALLDLLKDGEKRKRLATNARRTVLERYDSKIIAQETAKRYEKAIALYAEKQKYSWYMKGASQALEDTKAVLYAYDQMLYQTMCKYSLAFRLKHLARELFQRPKLFLAKTLVHFARRIAELSGQGQESVPALVLRLEQEIQSKEEEGRKLFWQQLAKPAGQS